MELERQAWDLKAQEGSVLGGLGRALWVPTAAILGSRGVLLWSSSRVQRGPWGPDPSWGHQAMVDRRPGRGGRGVTGLQEGPGAEGLRVMGGSPGWGSPGGSIGQLWGPPPSGQPPRTGPRLGDPPPSAQSPQGQGPAVE